VIYVPCLPHGKTGWWGCSGVQKSGQYSFSITPNGIIEVSNEGSFGLSQDSYYLGNRCSLFLLGSFTMQLISKYKSFVVSNIAWADALADALGKKDYLSDDVIEDLAEAHAEAYGEKYKRTIYFQQSSTGTWLFYTDEDCKKVNRDDTVIRQWQRTIQPYQKLNRKPTTSKQVDKVESKSKAIKSWGMTKAQVLKAVELAYAKK